VTTVDAQLARAPSVVVVGDRNSQLTTFLEERSIPAEEAGWEVIEDLDGVSVVVLQNPPALSRDDFLTALAAFDEAGVSVIFPADGWNTRTRAFDMLVEHTGSPSDYGRLGGVSGPEIFLHNLVDHPVFDGVEGDPVQLMNAASEAAFFPDYTGVRLADVALAGQEPAGIGIAYDARTPDSVHLLLTGLSATLRNVPDNSWTADGQQIFLNAVRWASDPGMGGFTGTITDAGGQPIPDATVEVTGTNWSAVTDANGAFEVAVPPGAYTLRYQAFGYVGQQRTLAVGPDQVVDASAQLDVGDVGTITGVVSSPDDGSLAGVRVDLLGTPYQTVTDEAGAYTFTLVEPGSYELELEVADHVRTMAPVEVSAGATSRADVVLQPSPLVGLIDDSTSASTRDRGREFLEDWGYRVELIDWDSLDRIPELDLVVGNRGQGLSSNDPGADGLHAFLEAVNRAGVSVLWMDQNGRGSIPFLHEYDGDPGIREQGSLDGPVTATVVEDHPLVAGLPNEFDLMIPDSRYTYFDEFGGTTVARLSTDAGSDLGATIAYRGRTASAVDVLLSTMSISVWGGPSTRQSAAFRWTPAAERVLVNALAWAVQAEGIGAEVRGTVRSDLGGTIPSQVTVVETGRTYQGRAGDGSFLVPLPPGEWTLTVSAFGHQTATVPVSLAAGDRLQPVITLTSDPTGQITGQVTDSAGEPVTGATVSVLETPLSAQTGPDGTYTVAAVPAGDWTLEFRAEGFQNARVAVTVTPGQAVPADVVLAGSRPVALAGDFNEEVARLLAGEGYDVDAYLYNQLDQIEAAMDDYDLAVLNGVSLASQQPSAEMFTSFVDAAAEADLPVIFVGMQNSGSIRHLTEHYGDPETIRASFELAGPVYYIVDEPHPIFAGIDISEPVEIMHPGDTTNQQYMFFGGYSGTTIADLSAPNRGERGDGVAYRFVSPSSVHLLLANLMAHGTNFGSPETNWSDAAKQIYLNAVDWAINARQAEVAGVVTGAGEPVAGASVTAVEAATSTTTGPDGSYAIGLVEGTYTIEVTAHGFAPATEQVVVPEAGTVTLDIDLVPLPRGEVSGVVTSATGEPVAGATVSGDGPGDWSATTGADGRYLAANLIEGDYQVTASADGFLPATGTVTISAAAPATLDLTLQPIDVGVLGDVDGALTGYLRDAGVPATELAWNSALDLTGYQVLLVNGGSPDEATFEAVLTAADTAEVSLIFTGTWAVDRGGIRLLERYTDRVVVGAQGFGDGPVQLTGFDPLHPLFAGLPEDPATLIVEGGYYSVLEEYAGQPLADLLVSRDGDEPVTGLAAGWDWRTAGSVELLLSASAVTEAVGPGLGWTLEGGQLVIDAIAWAREQVMAPPPAPTLVAAAPVVLGETVAVSGEAQWPVDEVTVLRDGEPAITVPVAEDGSWSAEVPLAVGDNPLTAVATNAAGDSPPSAPVTVARWVAEWEVRGQAPVRPVTLTLAGPDPWNDPAQQAELVVLDADGEEVMREQLQWVHGFYLHVLRRLPPGQHTLTAELMVDGHLLTIDGPTLS
jgi:protocatechuate 3,4-dioxygenase beta subunit